jgi:opacity protein-like surface antigen
MRGSKAVLLAGISCVALQIAAPAALAAPAASSAMAAQPPVWMFWGEGGWAFLGGGGDPYVPAFNNPPFSLMPDDQGFQIGGGFDYRFNGPWHFSAQFHYSKFGSNSGGSTPTATFNRGVATGTNSATRKEHYWSADFMVGRDMDIGGTDSQVQVGLRIAEIKGHTVGSATWPSIGSPSPSGQTRSYDQTDRFFGVGPRLAIVGSIPLMQSAFSIEYSAGIAGLWGKRSADQTVGIVNFGFGPATCLSGCPITISSSDNGFVFNADAQLGIAYAFNQHVKLSANYRIDAYWDALRSFNAGATGTNLDRYFHGPTVRLTVAY